VSVDELTRLQKLGLPWQVAFAVIDRAIDDGFAVEHWNEIRVADRWIKSNVNQTATFTPVWDVDPQHFYLTMDGYRPNEFTEDIIVIDVDVSEGVTKLTYQSGRSKAPFSSNHRSKSGHTAYRWALGKPVTPPLICSCNNEIAIVGGTHRFHLAHHYQATEIPCLARRDDADLFTILTHAKVRHS